MAGFVAVVASVVYTSRNYKTGPLGRLQKKVHILEQDAEKILREIDPLIQLHKEKLMIIIRQGKDSELREFLNKIDKGASKKWLDDLDECFNSIQHHLDFTTNDDKDLVAKLLQKVKDLKEIMEAKASGLIPGVVIDSMRNAVDEIERTAKDLYAKANKLIASWNEAKSKSDNDKLAFLAVGGKTLFKHIMKLEENLDTCLDDINKILQKEVSAEFKGMKDKLLDIKKRKERSMPQSGGKSNKRQFKIDVAKQERAEWLEHMRQKLKHK